MHIQIRNTIKQAWHLVKGSKRAYFCTFLVLSILQGFLLCVQEEFHHLAPHANWPAPAATLLMWFVTAPLTAGFLMMGLQRARKQAIKWNAGLGYFKAIFPLFAAYLITMLITWVVMMGTAFLALKLFPLVAHIPFLLTHFWSRIAILALAVIVICVITAGVNLLFSFNAILILDQKIPFHKAIVQSVKISSRAFRSFYGLIILLGLINLLGAALVGIGLLWTLPLSYISLGLVYESLTAVKTPE